MTEYEKMGGTYRQVGNYYLPNLEIAEQNEAFIGVWGQRRRRYLKEHHRVCYYNLLTAGTLNSYLAEVESQAQLLFDNIVYSYSVSNAHFHKFLFCGTMYLQRRNFYKKTKTIFEMVGI